MVVEHDEIRETMGGSFEWACDVCVNQSPDVRGFVRPSGVRYSRGVRYFVVLTVVRLTSSDRVWDVRRRFAQATDKVEAHVQPALEHS